MNNKPASDPQPEPQPELSPMFEPASDPQPVNQEGQGNQDEQRQEDHNDSESQKGNPENQKSNPEDQDDPFQWLQGLGKDLENNFAELDRKASKVDKASETNKTSRTATGSVTFESQKQNDVSSLFGLFSGLGKIGGSNNLGGFGGFGGLNGLLNNLTQMISGQVGHQNSLKNHTYTISRNIASEGQVETNVDPIERMSLEQIMRVAEMRIANFTGIDTSHNQVIQTEVVTRTQWLDKTIEEYGYLFQALSKAMRKSSDLQDAQDNPAPDHPMAALLLSLNHMLAPTMLAVTAGTMLGRLSHRAMNSYVLPIPRQMKASMLVLLPNVDDFQRQWTLPQDDLRFWVCLHEVAYRTVFGIKHVREHVRGLLKRHAEAFTHDTSEISNIFNDVNISMGPEHALSEIQTMMENPEAILSSVKSPEQKALQPELTAAITTITGYVDYVVHSISQEMLSTHSKLQEALLRHRAETGTSDKFSERMLGLELDQAQYDRGDAFIQGVIERADEQGLQRLFNRPENFPTPHEVDAPGLWLARIDIPR